MGSRNARWSRTGWIYSPELSYSVLWFSQGEETWTLEKLNLWAAIPCFCSHLPSLGCWGHRSYSLLQKNVLLLSRISALLLHQLHRAGRRGEERRGKVRQGGQLCWCWLLSQHSALDVWWVPGASRGAGSAAGHCLALEGGDRVWIAGDASKHPGVRSDTCLAAGQGAVLFALLLGKQSAAVGKCHPPHPAAVRSGKSFTLLSPVQKGEADSHASSPGKRRGWIHLAERRGRHWERGAGMSAEWMNLSPVASAKAPGEVGCVRAVLCCSLCLPKASRAGLCESAFLQPEQDSGQRQEDVRAPGAWQGGGWRGPH